MLDEKYINFFEKIRLFKEEQKKQKQRGLNDYNMVNVVRKENAEVGMHSNVIYSLIDPNGLHYQDDLFLNKFITIVLGEKIENFGSILSVQAEELTFENRRIDFTIKSTNYYIGIEMKIDANDLNNQINDYEVDLITKAKNENIENVVIYYLTKDGKEAAQHSCKDVTYKRISFENHILNWIENCQKEVRNITNLNEAFENYKDIVKKITNKYEGRVMSLKNELLKNEEYFELAKEISEALKRAMPEYREKQINLIIEIVEERKLKFENHFPRNTAIDILSEFVIRFIANDNAYLIQVFDKSGYDKDKTLKIVDIDKKNVISSKLTKINNRFKCDNKVYGYITINYQDTDKEKLDVLLSELINLKDEI
ncbi:PD-(D/E)XK nuclease family protein [Arcobacter cryaerophilus gv. pseudocryaerophilus]|uniref:PD-(D/E)XK nuclease family protein n=3 Tax=unclassified Arcobacter TaxID=2593671 RepID=A0AA96DH63_9BACT|nr:PD-(D/E)XK nuclease family protein [Arcobacter sp. AZ-2023]WPD05086.1 PD-(D/E)XK nuclease family protein [Arcobacter sp. DSM 115956]WPD07180.1 PD-(D/E)XK nuclease family protein [Arcobacter sp. DSM 115955]WNL31445.1 PD-(D/E)XK nuclease family protein [Arcobacter sp. AZ-2023]WNP37595.1 PD-(D/E)XK nuclease family protein [Arcobacter sp. AZ-2023]